MGRLFNHIFPQSLKGRLLLFMMVGTTLAMTISGALYLWERGRTLYYTGGIQTAERFAAIVKLMDPVDTDTRHQLALAMETPHQFIRFSDKPLELEKGNTSHAGQAKFVHALLEQYLGDPWPLRVTVLDQQQNGEPIQALQNLLPPSTIKRHRREVALDNKKPVESETEQSSPEATSDEKSPTQKLATPATSKESSQESDKSQPSSQTASQSSEKRAQATDGSASKPTGIEQKEPAEQQRQPQPQYRPLYYSQLQPMGMPPGYMGQIPSPHQLHENMLSRMPRPFNPYMQAPQRDEQGNLRTTPPYNGFNTPSNPALRESNHSKQQPLFPGLGVDPSKTQSTNPINLPTTPFTPPIPNPLMVAQAFEPRPLIPAFKPEQAEKKAVAVKQAITMEAKEVEPAPPLEKRLLPDGLAFIAQVRLHDGVWAIFHNHLPETLFEEPKRLLVSVSILFLTMLFFTWIVVRQALRPLSILAKAAEALGQDIQRPPLSEKGSEEMRQAARAMNMMQARTLRFVQERTHLLAALSHDLKTPLTRMRLRAEMMQNQSLQKKLLTDLEEMESMAACSLDFIRGMEGGESYEATDLKAMLEQIQSEHADMGNEVHLLCDEIPLVQVKPKSLKRCLDNLIRNAVAYGKRAYLRAGYGRNGLHIVVADDGPGIPDDELEKVFDPFVRLETSRNRKSGGTGLGLGIARNIARSHNGDLELSNRPEGGLEAVISLPDPKHD
uniref:histidine kinase n=1 Tax=Magnetococcus massalia (strain MO-1) TaxID=451514 RepID=A0A1S7LGY6_MAGMO|nr:Putative histidine kinase [Candidatus Magnetococcus massalia]